MVTFNLLCARVKIPPRLPESFGCGNYAKHSLQGKIMKRLGKTMGKKIFLHLRTNSLCQWKHLGVHGQKRSLIVGHRSRISPERI